MPIQRRTVRSGHRLAAAFVALSVAGFGPAVQAFAQDAPPPDGATQDPPSRVGYLSLIEGTVSMHASATDPWAPASINYPMTAGSSIWTEPGAKAEIQIGAARIDLDGGTELDIVAVDDQNVDVNVPQGRVDVHVHGRQPTENYEVTAPRGTAALTVDGTYRIYAGDDQAPTRIAALYGNAQLLEPNGNATVETNNELIVTSGDPLQYTQQALQDDGFDHWVGERMHRFDAPPAHQYVSPQVVGAQDLEQYGTWQTTPQYGSVWIPSSVSADWAPYREGHWRWVAPWGWTWVDDEPWGFAPFHYGRWAQVNERWAWVPGEVVARPVYAPAMVVFVGGDPGPRPGVGIAVGIGVGVGIGAAIGWVPLGPGEVYRPPYHVSENYIRNVNVTNVSRTTVNNITVNNVTNVTNVTYANQRAVTVVNHDAFVNAQPVRQAALPQAQAATFTHPIVASAARPAPGGAPAAALPQPTAASRVGPVTRPAQAPPHAQLAMPATHVTSQGRIVPTAIPAAAAAATPRPGAPATPAAAPGAHGPAQPAGAAPGVPHPQPAPQAVPQPHAPNQPAAAVPHPGVQQNAVQAPHAPAVATPPAVAHPQAQPQAAPHPQPQPQAVPHPQAQPQAVPHPQPQAAPHPQAQPQAVPHPQPQAAPHPQPQPQAHPQAQPQAAPRPQPQQPHPQPQPQPPHPQPQPPKPQPHPEDKKDEHPTAYRAPAGHAPPARPAPQPVRANHPAPQKPEHNNKPA